MWSIKQVKLLISIFQKTNVQNRVIKSQAFLSDKDGKTIKLTINIIMGSTITLVGKISEKKTQREMYLLMKNYELNQVHVIYY